MQARRRAQPSGTNSPSSSHPRLKHRARCVIFFRARHAAARVAPDRGSWQARISEPRGSAPRERDHRGGDHPVPSRTRQLSPPSPRVLQRKAAGGQGVALAEGAFLYAARARLGRRVRGMRRERPAGEHPPAAFSAFRGCSLRCGASYFCVYGQRLRPFLCSGRVLPKGARLPQEPEDSWGVLASLFCITELMRRAQNGRSNRFTDETWRRI